MYSRIYMVNGLATLQKSVVPSCARNWLFVRAYTIRECIYIYIYILRQRKISMSLTRARRCCLFGNVRTAHPPPFHPHNMRVVYDAHNGDCREWKETNEYKVINNLNRISVRRCVHFWKTNKFIHEVGYGECRWMHGNGYNFIPIDGKNVSIVRLFGM